MWIAFLIWFLVIVALLVAILLLARAESHRDAFSASIPDGQEYDARRAHEEERRRGSARIVAPGIVIQPSNKVEPGVTGASSDGVDELNVAAAGVKPVVATSQRVVEVRGILGSRKPVLAGQAAPVASEGAVADEVAQSAQAGSDAEENIESNRPLDSLDSLEEGLNMAQSETYGETPAFTEQPLISQEELEQNAERVASIAAHSARKDAVSLPEGSADSAEAAADAEVPHSVAAPDMPELPLPARSERESKSEAAESEEASEGSPSLANLVSKTEEKEELS